MVPDRIVRELATREGEDHFFGVAVAGMGRFGRGLINQFGLMKTMRPAAFANRHPKNAVEALARSGFCLKGRTCADPDELDRPAELLDGIGAYTFYGMNDCAEVVWDRGLLPIGVAPGGRLRRAVKVDEPIRLDDGKLDRASVAWKLRQQQDRRSSRARA